jgi:hypothetical protein
MNMANIANRIMFNHGSLKEFVNDGINNLPEPNSPHDIKTSMNSTQVKQIINEIQIIEEMSLEETYPNLRS